MNIFHFGGKVKCNSFEELIQVLQKRYKNNANEYELYSNGSFPFMTLLVKGELACIHIFQSKEDCGHYAYINENILSKDDSTTFYIGSPTAETQISNKLVIPYSIAIKVIRDFFENQEMSNFVKWFAL